LQAVAYDWVFPLFTDAQKATVIAWFRKIMDTRDTSAAGASSWNPENARAGDGMVLALATAGAITDHDYVADFWTNNWNASSLAPNQWTPWTYHWAIQEMGDCGSNEGFGYYTNNVSPNFLTKGLWETATGGNNFLKIGWFDRYPLWFLFQHEPNFG